MRKLLLLLFSVFCFSVSAQQPVLVLGHTQNMQYTSINPDWHLGCDTSYYSSTGYYTGCSGKYFLGVDSVAGYDIEFRYNNGECGGSSNRVYTIDASILSDISILVDTQNYMRPLLAPAYTANDTIYSDVNTRPDSVITSVWDSVQQAYVPDTNRFVNQYAWVDSNYIDISWYGTCGGNFTGGWAKAGNGVYYLVFRKVLPADTLYGWIEMYAAPDVTFLGFAITGDTGSYIYSTVQEINSELHVSLYPNPVSDKLSIESPFENYALEIFSVEGCKQMAAHQKRKNETIDVSELHAGCYFLNIVSNGRLITQRFIKE